MASIPRINSNLDPWNFSVNRMSNFVSTAIATSKGEPNITKSLLRLRLALFWISESIVLQIFDVTMTLISTRKLIEFSRFKFIMKMDRLVLAPLPLRGPFSRIVSLKRCCPSRRIWFVVPNHKTASEEVRIAGCTMWSSRISYKIWTGDLAESWKFLIRCCRFLKCTVLL